MIERLRADHRDALFAFERENRAYFAASVPDRGDHYFALFDERHRALLDEQDTGACHFHVIVGEIGGEHGGEVLGRVNLVDVTGGAAELGFRVAEKVAGRGVATAAVREMSVMARETYGLTVLRAAAAVANPGSRGVLAGTGFVATGEEVTLSGRPGHWFRLDVTRTA